MKRGQAYLRKGKIFVVAVSRTTEGFWITTEPVQVVEQDQVELLGRSLLSVLSASTDGVQHPASWSNVGSSLLAAASVRSWTEFNKGSKLVELELNSGEIEYLPTHLISAKEGFEHLTQDAFKVPTNDVVAGRALLKAFELCD